MLTQDIAHVCHEANRAYAYALGDKSHLPWEEAPPWMKASTVEGVIALRDHPGLTPRELHDQWMTGRRGRGWVYGPTKNEFANPPTHPNLVPYDQLNPDERRKDSLFAAIVQTLLGGR